MRHIFVKFDVFVYGCLVASGVPWYAWQRFRSDVATRPQRQGVSGVRATVFGAYGFTGRYVIHLLAGGGTRCIVPFRGDDYEVRHLRVAGDYGQVVPVPFSPRDEDSMRRAIAGSDVVINLIGKDYETTHYLPWMVNSSFEFTHCEVPRTLARLCVEEGVGNFIHVSSLAADEHSLSRWARSKAHGEKAVRDEAPGATIVRPADMFGHEDRLLNLYVRLYQMFPQLPLVDGGKARAQPLFVQDFARAVAHLAMSEDPEEMLAQTYDLAGPEVYTQRELVEFVFEAIRAVRPHVANISPRIASWIGKSFELLPEPIISEDRMTRLQLDCVLDDVSRAKRLHDLGIEASSLEMPGYTWLHSFRTGSHFLDIKEAKQHSA